jgi:hypothetical protein
VGMLSHFQQIIGCEGLSFYPFLDDSYHTTIYISKGYASINPRNGQEGISNLDRKIL